MANSPLRPCGPTGLHSHCPGFDPSPRPSGTPPRTPNRSIRRLEVEATPRRAEVANEIYAARKFGKLLPEFIKICCEFHDRRTNSLLTRNSDDAERDNSRDATIHRKDREKINL
jgi:hypothetical protein